MENVSSRVSIDVSSSTLNPNAQIFVPRSQSTENREVQSRTGAIRKQSNPNRMYYGKTKLCEFHSKNAFCPNERCGFIHGKMCDLCGQHCLHPHNKSQQRKHTKKCIKEHEERMETAFLYHRSKDKTCSVCFDVVWEKEEEEEQMFGILPNCIHCFCISCILQWRKSDGENWKTCPECRTIAEFVYPSDFWIDDQEEKTQVLEKYKSECAAKHCRFLKRGSGLCPYGNDCLFKHVDMNGDHVESVGQMRGPGRLRTEFSTMTDLSLESLRSVRSLGSDFNSFLSSLSLMSYFEFDN